MAEFKLVQDTKYSNMFNAKQPHSLFAEIASLTGGMLFSNMRVKVKSEYTAEQLTKFVFKRAKKHLKLLQRQPKLSQKTANDLNLLLTSKDTFNLKDVKLYVISETSGR